MEIVYSEAVKLVVSLTEQMARDYEECERRASISGGEGKDCRTCSLGMELIEDYGLCDLPAVQEELERMVQNERSE